MVFSVRYYMLLVANYLHHPWTSEGFYYLVLLLFFKSYFVGDYKPGDPCLRTAVDRHQSDCQSPELLTGLLLC